MIPLLYISLCISGITLVSLLIILALGDYPRVTTKTRAHDVLSVAFSFSWIMAIVLVLWGAK